jgi:hypothetical protein
VFVAQGHYATDQAALDSYPAADVTVQRIADLLELAESSYRPAGA